MGRPLYHLEVLIPAIVDDIPGYWEIVPFVFAEKSMDATENTKVGIWVNKGFLPEKYGSIVERERTEIPTPILVHGYISNFDKYQEGSTFVGNSHMSDRSVFRTVDLVNSIFINFYPRQKCPKTFQNISSTNTTWLQAESK